MYLYYFRKHSHLIAYNIKLTILLFTVVNEEHCMLPGF